MSTPFKGPGLDEFQVFFNAADITALVDKVILHESIGSPFMMGHLEITDSAGFLDSHITGNSYILIKWVYHDEYYTAAYFMDGVRHVNFENVQHEKSYIIDLKSFNELGNAMSTISKAFTGSATEVINSIFKEAGLGQLDIFSEAKNSGKYIAPMASPYKCIFDILFHSYDHTNNPLFLFEQLSYVGLTEQQVMIKEQNEGMEVDTSQIGSTIIQSWKDMLASPPKFTIKPVLPDEESAGISDYGMPKHIIVDHDHAAMTNRIKRGVDVEEITTVDINNTTHSSDTFNIYDKYYADNPMVAPQISIQGDLGRSKRTVINNMGSQDQVMLCGNTSAENAALSQCQSIRSKSTAVSISALECNAIPTLRSGDTLNLEIPIGTKVAGSGLDAETALSPKYKGKYVVGGITHIIECADMLYTQNINMIRDGGPVSDEEKK